jgi:chromosome segregation ATPase
MRTLFILFICIGFIVIATLGFFEPVFQFFLPITVMMVFYIIAKSKGASPHQVGDSSYYLGFTFTLISLLISFNPLFNADIIFSPDKIIANFGVAVSSTILGIILRIIEVQYAELSDEDVAQANSNIVESLNKFAIRVSMVEKDFESSADQLVKNHEAAMTQLNAAANHNFELHEHSVNAINRQIDELSNATANAFGEINQQVKVTLETTVSNAIEAAINSSRGLIAEETKTLSLELDHLQNSLRDYGDSIGNIVENLSKNSSFESLGELDESLKVMARSAKKSEKMNESIEEFYEQNKNYSAAISTQTRDMLTSLKSITDNNTNVVNISNSLAVSMQTVNDTVKSIQEKLGSLDEFEFDFISMNKNIDEIARLKTEAVTINAELNSAVIESSQKLLKALA